MNQEENINKGRSILKMKVATKYKQECTDPDLLKIPLEGLHSIALQQIGEQESYIQELEEKIAKAEADMAACVTDYTRLQELSEEKEKLETKLEERMERWMELSELAEEIERTKG